MKELKVLIVMYLLVVLTVGCTNKVSASITVEIPKKTNVLNSLYGNYIEPEDIIRDTSALGGVYAKFYTKYIAYIAPNGKPILIVAQDKVTDEQMLKSYGILKFYLTDYGIHDRTIVANQIADNNSIIVMPNGADGDSKIPNRALAGQPLYQMEVPTIGSEWYMTGDLDHRDAAYEEILHLVHDYGIGTINNKGALESLQKEIYIATMKALPKNKKDWGNKGLWGLGEREWLLELDKEGSLEQEYLAAIVDSYYGLWSGSTDSNGGMYGLYIAKSRKDIEVKDPIGYKIVQGLLPEYQTMMARIDPEFEGEFKMQFDQSLNYTYKSQYLLKARLLGLNPSNLSGNNKDNVLMGNSSSNLLDGKDGHDIVQLIGKSTDYKINRTEDYVEILSINNNEDIDKLINIEILRFTDEDVEVLQLPL